VKVNRPTLPLKMPKEIKKKARNTGQYFTPEHVADFMISLSKAPKDAQA